MTQKDTLTITSLLSILFLSFHLADDIVRGFEPGKLSTIVGIFIMVAWLCGTLLLAGKRPGYIVTLVFSALAFGVPVIHMTGAGMAGGRIVNSTGKFFWVWTLLMIGVTTTFSVILSARELWSLQRPSR